MTDIQLTDELSPAERRALLTDLLRTNRARPRVLPLAPAQQRLWFLDRLVPGHSVYNIPMAMWLSGPLDCASFERALSEVARRHEALRTTFSQRDGEPMQVVAPDGAVYVAVVDLTAFPEDQREGEALRLANEEARRPFDLEQGPLLRVSLLDLGDNRRLSVLVMHHIVSEAWSVSLLLEEVSRLYQAFVNGLPSPLPELPLQYGDFANWQRNRAAGAGVQPDLDYWRRQLAGAPPFIEIPTDRPRPAMRSYRGAWKTLQLAQSTTEALHAFSRREGVTPFMSLLAAYGILLHRYSGAPEVVVGAPVAGRNRPETEKLIGFFVNTLALRIDLAGAPTFRELVARVRETCVGAFEHQDVPFERLVEELQPNRTLSHSPIFQVMFALQNAPPPVLRLPGIVAEAPVSAAQVHNGGAKADLSFFITEAAGELSAAFEYASDLFDGDTIAQMLESFRELLDGALAEPDRQIDGLSLLTEEQRHRVLVEWNETATAFPRDRSIPELFEAQAARTPDAQAVRFGDDAVTYRELDE
ncbi:MAG: condensation domain-containing protein, partial [Gemmatimonadaceae bacterium]